MRDRLRRALDGQRLRDLDFHFAACLCEVARCDAPELWLAAALASRATADGHVCIALDELAGRPVLDEPALIAPPLDSWREALRASGAVGGGEGGPPLVLDGRDRLYLGRYWHFERILVRELMQRATAAEVDVARARAGLARLFPASDGEDDPQRRAAAVALLRRLAVISGGPGTGKTTTVTRLLALLVEQSWPKVPRIALAAPTGKAAARLTESIKQAKQTLACDAQVRDAIPEEAGTVHRLLRAIPGETGFRHHAGNPLHLDVLVVDEASMVDVSLMARLLDALPPEARLVLLGDRDQLSSVEAGSVLGDVCNRGEEMPYSTDMAAQLAVLGERAPAMAVAEGVPAMADSLAVLTRSYRFGSDSGIGRLARAVNRGDAAAALEVCADAGDDTRWREIGEADVNAAVAAAAVAGYRACLETTDPQQALALFSRFRFLCALREGPFGVRQVNAVAEAALRRAGLLPASVRHYAGRPLLITRNDYALGLFNGDIGMVLPDPQAGGRLRAFFVMPDGQLRRVLLHRLPAHETVFAMTVHKSQGSEFARCVVLLPDVDAPVLSRELVYTGLTRAREGVELWGTRTVFARAVQRRIERSSGLRDALWGES
ncbi:MAG: exodeoxyribonuclease V subunit alpha [Gammaproteobacteria bacterium]|nr:exodeoxyribonuclease V subunit alpha [Gammaproteobacteria bacterium]